MTQFLGYTLTPAQVFCDAIGIAAVAAVLLTVGWLVKVTVVPLLSPVDEFPAPPKPKREPGLQEISRQMDINLSRVAALRETHDELRAALVAALANESGWRARAEHALRPVKGLVPYD